MKTISILTVLTAVTCLVGNAHSSNCQDEYTRLKAENDGRLGTYLPSCDAKNSTLYNPLQCIENECYCVNEKGEKLQNYNNIPIQQPSKCACARDEDEYISKSVAGQRYDCAPDGSYKPVHCIGSKCSCMDEDGPLPNYETFLPGKSECACARAMSEIQARKLQDDLFFCASDGSYEPVYCTGSMCFCVDKLGETITPYQYNIRHYNKAKQECQQARLDLSKF